MIVTRLFRSSFRFCEWVGTKTNQKANFFEEGKNLKLDDNLKNHFLLKKCSCYLRKILKFAMICMPYVYISI